MKRLGRTLLAFILTFGLVWGPFGHALAMARMNATAATVVAEVVPACHQTASALEAEQAKPALDDCCCHKGSKCHCATAVLTLPSSALLMSSQDIEPRFVALSSFLFHPLPAPEPPPPRSLR